MSKLNFPGNILLDANEGNLEKQSIIEVSKQQNVSQTDLGEFIGKLSEERLKQIKTGREFINTSFHEPRPQA